MLYLDAHQAHCSWSGWSFGGVVAFETARQLLRASVNVAGILLVDSPNPSTKSGLANDVIDSAFDGQDRISEMIRTQMRYSTRALVDYEPSQSPVEGTIVPMAIMLRCTDAFPLKSVLGESELFLADRTDRDTFVSGWEAVLGCEVSVFDIPGHHFEAFSPQNVCCKIGTTNSALIFLQVDATSAEMRKALDLLDRNTG